MRRLRKKVNLRLEKYRLKAWYATRFILRLTFFLLLAAGIGFVLLRAKLSK